jgi:phenylalanyl-tRNA synthetase beta chain
MKISCNWLKEYVNHNLEPVEVARILTDCGLEVEAIEEYESVKGSLKGVVIGHVQSVQRHPNADKLSCCKVDVGSGTILDIVCGAPNVAEGQKVPVATIGTVLYSGDQSFAIKAGKLRGEPSNSMICAEDELGLGTSHAGIMVLDQNAVAGTPAADYFGIVTDTVLEVAITPNRSDATSHIGVARDLVAALNNRELKSQKHYLNKPSVADFKVDHRNLHISVEVLNPEACTRYSALTLTDVKVTDSPAWMQNRLKAAGIRPINNIVDITNYVLLETGQPLHAFDAAMVTGNKVLVKKMAAETKFVTLDGTERVLAENDLMICNQNEGMCIAGVFGGIKSGVTTETTSVFLESACFEATHIRKTSRQHNLKTDASFRFERGSDPNITVYALKRAALLIAELAGGRISSDIIDVYPNVVADHTVKTTFEKINSLIGKSIAPNVVKNILTDLEIKIDAEDEVGLVLQVPPFKTDVTREADVIEEILRIYGYNNVETSTDLKSSLSFSRKPDPERLAQKLCDYLSANGFNEILTNSLTSISYYEHSVEFPLEKCVKILNPLSNELGVMRQTLLFGGLESIAFNLNRRSNDLQFYEFGNVYEQSTQPKEGLTVTDKYHETRKLSLFVTGNAQRESWYNAVRKIDFYTLKSQTFALLTKAGIALHNLSVENISSGLYTMGQSYMLQNKNLLTIAQVNTQLLKQFGIKQDVFYAEINWPVLINELKPDSVSFREISRFPEVRRDLALLLDKKVTFTEIETLAYKNGKGILRAVNLFDVYEGEKIESGKKSYAVSFTLQDNNKTLADNDIDKIMKRLCEVFEKELGAQLRK